MSDGCLWPLQEPRDGPQFYGLIPLSSFSQNQGQLTSDIVSFLLQRRVPWKDSKATYSPFIPVLYNGPRQNCIELLGVPDPGPSRYCVGL